MTREIGISKHQTPAAINRRSNRVGVRSGGAEVRCVRSRSVCPPRLVLSCALAVCLLAGCRSVFDVTALRQNDEYPELAGTDKIRGPLGRFIGGKKEADAAENLFHPTEGQRELERAQQLADAGEYKQAEKAAHRIVKKYKDTAVHEDAVFLRGEAQFQQRDYAAAQDSFDLLLSDYPSTRYMDRVTRRLFTIAQHWMGFSRTTNGDVQMANHEEPNVELPETAITESKDPTVVVPILPNLFDRTRPLFDTQGRALQALKAIWLNDPTGPLADDALMLTASYHLRKANYLEADRIFNILREEYPKSPHLQDAFVLGSHVKLMSFQGAQYDSKNLVGAEALKESALRLFPDEVDQQRLQRELRLIQEAKAQKKWEQANYYLKKKNNTRAAAIYCELVIRDYPDTQFSGKAREMLRDLNPRHPLVQPPKPATTEPATPAEVPYDETPFP